MFEVWTHPLPKEGFTLRGWYTPPTGKPLIHFLHGNGFCGRTYEPMLRLLAQDFDLWLSDIQGHGDSDPGPRFLGWNRNATLALQAFEAQGRLFGNVPRFAVGHSFGGVLTALLLGGRRPHPFKKAVLLDPVLFPPLMLAGVSAIQAVGLGKSTPLAAASLKRRSLWASRQEAADSLRGRGTYKGWTEAALQAFVDHALKPHPDGGVTLKCAPRLEADIFSSAPKRLWPSISRIHVPTLVVHGSETFPFVTPSAKRAEALNRSIQTEQIQGGHCFMQADPEQAAQSVKRFLLPG